MSLLLTIFIWFFTIIACTSIGLIIYTTWNYGVLDGLGFPVIKPFLFFGSNYMEPYRVSTELSMERLEKYGTVYGAYDGRRPLIYVSDPTMTRLIRTVDSDCFRNHGFEFGIDRRLPDILELIKDKKWKTVRAGLTPILSTGKIKQISKLVKDIVEEYTEYLANNNVDGIVEKFDMKEFSKPLIIECLAKAFHGIEIHNARDPNNEFIRNFSEALLHNMGSENWLTYSFRMFPFLQSISQFLAGQPGMDYFISVMRSTLEAKQKSNFKTSDAGNVFAEMLCKVKNGDKEYKSLGINEMTIIAQAWELFTASFLEIRNSPIAFFYELSKNSELQEKIYNEIKNSEDEANMPLVMASIKEILRIYMLFDKSERLCNRTWKYGGITIPKGIQVFIPTSAIHYNPKYFPDPMTFKPERFLDKANPIDPNLCNSFGQGPRGCFGQRFGIEITRVIFISFVKKFKFVSRTDTEFVQCTGAAFTAPVKPCYLDLVLR